MSTAAAVEDVGGDTGNHREQDDWHHANEADHAEREAAAPRRDEQRDVPQQRGLLHERAGKRNGEANPEQPEIPVAEGD
jgi:hypothetical protein